MKVNIWVLAGVFALIFFLMNALLSKVDGFNEFAELLSVKRLLISAGVGVAMGLAIKRFPAARKE
jgi:hypothetical protein